MEPIPAAGRVEEHPGRSRQLSYMTKYQFFFKLHYDTLALASVTRRWKDPLKQTVRTSSNITQDTCYFIHFF